MEEYITRLKDICRTAANILQNVSKSNNIQYRCYEVDCSYLKNEYIDKENITQADWFKNIFDSCHAGPTLYLIEKISGPSNEKLLQLLKEYKATQKARGTSAIKKNPNINSAFLYVGKVKERFYGRVIQHLGFFQNSKTAGLQIFHWLQGIPMVIKFHAYHFDEEMANYMSVMEYEFAKKLRPLIGKIK